MALEQPKKPSGGAFGQFLSEKRAGFIKQCAGKPITEVTKVAGAAWKALSEAERGPYQKKYEAAKAKYETDFAAFTAAGGVKEKGAAALRTEKKKAVANGTAEPKRPLGAYPQWMADNRQMLTEKIMAKLGVDKAKVFLMLYKEARPFFDALSAAEKKKLEEIVEAAKVKYQAEHKAWKEAGGKGQASSDAGKKEIKDPNRPKKPAGGAFGCFMEQNRPALIKECAGQAATASVKLGSTRWKALSEAEKAVFDKAYEKKKAAYDEAMKSYVPPAGAAMEDGDDDEEGEGNAAEQSPPAKKAKRAASSPAGADAKKAKTAASTPADADVLAQAKKDGFDRQLKTMLENPQVQSKKLSASVVLKALQDAGGKMVAAKKALLGGA
jgi:hypothetical protein